MKEFMILFKGGVAKQKDMDSNREKWMKWMKGVVNKGVYVRGEPFMPKGKVVSGYEKKEEDYLLRASSVQGYAIIKGNNMSDVIKVTRDCPIFEDNGEVVVMELLKM